MNTHNKRSVDVVIDLLLFLK